jgi:hypothetical protein
MGRIRKDGEREKEEGETGDGGEKGRIQRQSPTKMCHWVIVARN